MEINNFKDLCLNDIQVLSFKRFRDDRGYFTEHFRQSQIQKSINLSVFQTNESYSKANVIRGLHFQWNPFMGKLIRTIHGHMVDLVLDIRKNSSTLGKIIGYDMPSNPDQDYQEWIWVPPGFAHGNFFLENTTIEYFCSGEYSKGCEAGICPFDKNIDWSLCSKDIQDQFNILKDKAIISIKDKNGLTLDGWLSTQESNNFI